MNQQILVCNCGSSSAKLEVFALHAGEELKSIASGSAGRIGSEATTIRVAIGNATSPMEIKKSHVTHRECIETIVEAFLKNEIFGAEAQFAVGHRVVHGGSHARDPIRIDDRSEQLIEDCSSFAPLHNPVNLDGIRACRALFDCPQFAVFDTAFHSTMPEAAYSYAIPAELARKHSLRRYGFHGTSHHYCYERVQELRNQAPARMINLHLGNGASVCAIENGKSVDTSMGFTPLEGLVMGTRCGDLDPAIPGYLMKAEGLTTEELDRLLNKKSGLLGLSGKSDMRDLLEAASRTDGSTEQRAAELAIECFCLRIRKYIGAYAATLGGVEVIAFTGGIGENSPQIRERILADLTFLGLRLDKEKNLRTKSDSSISSDDSKVEVFIIAADEEKAIARSVRRVSEGQS